MSVHCCECGEPVRLEDDIEPVIYNGRLLEAHSDCLRPFEPSTEDEGNLTKEKGSCDG